MSDTSELLISGGQIASSRRAKPIHNKKPPSHTSKNSSRFENSNSRPSSRHSKRDSTNDLCVLGSSNLSPKRSSRKTSQSSLNLQFLASSQVSDVSELAQNSQPWTQLQDSTRSLSGYNTPVLPSDRSEKTIVLSPSSPVKLPKQILADDFLFIVNRAAVTIQVWYRYIKKRQIKKYLLEKQRMFEKSVEEERQAAARAAAIEEARKKEREEMLNKQRKQRVEELRKAREAKRLEENRIKEERRKQLAEQERKKEEKRKQLVEDEMKKVKFKIKQQQETIKKAMDSHQEIPVRLNSNEYFDGNHNLNSSKTTLDDLLATIKQLEDTPEDVQDLTVPTESATAATAWIDELEASLERRPTEDKAIEDNVPEVTPLLVPSAEELLKLEDANKAAAEVTGTMLSQQVALAEKQRSVELLQRALNQQRELAVTQAKEQEQETRRRLNQLRDELEAKVQRQTGFLDQLIETNTKLSDKCQKLTVDIKENVAKYEKKIKSMQTTHETEMLRLKETLTAAEKLRREKWMEEQTRKLKDITVKGLEPEIQRLIQQHRAEVKKLKALHEAEMLEAEERAGQKFVAQVESLREQLASEKESACERERVAAQQRCERQVQQEQALYEQHRRRLYTEIAEEKQRLADSAARQRAESERSFRESEEKINKTVDKLKHDHEETIREMEERHQLELRKSSDISKVEFEAWQETVLKKMEAELASKERNLRQQVRAERDREIELVVERLEAEQSRSRTEHDMAADARVRRLREKYEAEIREAEAGERAAGSRLAEAKAALASSQGETARLQSLLAEKEAELSVVERTRQKLSRERDNVADVVRQEFADRLAITDDENRQLKNELSEVRATQKLAIERLNRDKEREMDEVHKRVKQALVKKEETVNQIRAKYQAAEKRADHLETLLDQIRKQQRK